MKVILFQFINKNLQWQLIISRYFSPQTPKSSDVVDDEEESLNPFKSRKIPQKKEDISEHLSISSSSIYSMEENKPQNEEITKEIPTNKFHTQIPSTIQKAFCWNNYSNKTSKTKNEGCDSTNNGWISQNENNSINDNQKVKY